MSVHSENFMREIIITTLHTLFVHTPTNSNCNQTPSVPSIPCDWVEGRAIKHVYALTILFLIPIKVNSLFYILSPFLT